jgi:hypothetical protein
MRLAEVYNDLTRHAGLAGDSWSLKSKQARQIINVVAREVSKYKILVIPKNQRPPITKKKGKRDSAEGSHW